MKGRPRRGRINIGCSSPQSEAIYSLNKMTRDNAQMEATKSLRDELTDLGVREYCSAVSAQKGAVVFHFALSNIEDVKKA